MKQQSLRTDKIAFPKTDEIVFLAKFRKMVFIKTDKTKVVLLKN